MDKSKKITWGQLFVMIFISKAFFLMMSPVSNNDIQPSLYIWGQIISIPIMLVLLIPTIYLIRKSFDFSSNIILQKLTGLLYLIATLSIGINSLVNFQKFLVDTFFPFTSGTALMILLILGITYGIYLGLEPLARAGGIVMFFVLIGTGLISFSFIDKIDMAYFKPLADITTQNITTITLSSLIANQDFILILLLSAFTNSNNPKGLKTLLISSSGFYSLMIFFIITVLGGYINHAKYPLYSISSIANLAVIGRLDSVFMMLWVWIAFIRITLFILSADYALSLVIEEKKDRGKYIITGLILVISTIFTIYPDMGELFTKFTSSGIIFLICIVILPLLYITQLKFESNRKGKV